MPDIISYLVNMRGAEFNRHLRSEDQVPEEYFRGLTKEQPDYREARLKNDETTFGVDVTGEWTEIGLSYPYSALLEEEPTVKSAELRYRISEWERRLREQLPLVEVIRVARSLFDNWEATAGESPVHGPESVQKFREWLKTQDRRYWSYLPNTRP